MGEVVATRNFEGKICRPITTDVISKFGGYCDKLRLEGALLASGEFSLHRPDDRKIRLENYSMTLQNRFGVLVERKYYGLPALDAWLKQMFPSGVDEDKILYRLGQK
jgi:hypothetical protein